MGWRAIISHASQEPTAGELLFSKQIPAAAVMPHCAGWLRGEFTPANTALKWQQK